MLWIGCLNPFIATTIHTVWQSEVFENPLWRTVSSIWICFGVWRQRVFTHSWFSSRYFHFPNQWLVFLWIFTTRLSDNHSLAGGGGGQGGGVALAATTRVTNWAPRRGNDTGNIRSESGRRNPCVSDLLIASLIPLMNSASQCLCPEWQHGTGHRVGSGDGEGVRCHLLCHCALHFPLLELNRRERQQWKILSRWQRCRLRPPPSGHLKTLSTNYSCHSHYASFRTGSIWAVGIQWFVIIAKTAGDFHFDSVCHVWLFVKPPAQITCLCILVKTKVSLKY